MPHPDQDAWIDINALLDLDEVTEDGRIPGDFSHQQYSEDGLSVVTIDQLLDDE